METQRNKITLENMTDIKTRSKKRLGRGYGSGKGGHTVGRGTKGDKARGKTPLTFSGTKIKKSALKRLPLARGRGKLKSFGSKPVIVNLKYLNLLPPKTVVNTEALVKYKIVTEKEANRCGVKILGEGKLSIPLRVELPCSRGAREEIEKAGGRVTGSQKETSEAEKKPVVQKEKKTKRK